MSVKRVPVTDSIRYGWDTMRANLGFFIVLLIVIFTVNAFFSVFSGLFENRLPIFSLVFSLGSLFASLVINLVVIKIALKFCDNDRRGISEVISFDASLFFKFAAGYFLYVLIVAVGFLLLIVPGIIWIIKYQYVVYLIVDKGLGPVESLKRSSEITQGIKWELFGFLLLLGLINIAGALVFVIGLFATVPTTIVAMAWMYRKLSAPEGEFGINPFQSPGSAG
ncbi:MAG: hypothetical protein RIG61_02310 [Deltaproteobacteria bacterium]